MAGRGRPDLLKRVSRSRRTRHRLCRRQPRELLALAIASCESPANGCSAPRRALAGGARDGRGGAACSAGDVALAIVGVPGSWILAWNECTISGTPITAVDAPPRAGADGPAHAGELAAWSCTRSARRPRVAFRGFSTTAGGALRCLPPSTASTTCGESSPRCPRHSAPWGFTSIHPPALSTRERVTLDTALQRG